MVKENKNSNAADKEGLEKLHKAMQDQCANMTKKNVEFINKKLSKESPAILIKILETFVAMLRNTKKADMVDVEIYFTEYSKLAKKM